MPPLNEGNQYRSMTVLPYLEDLHNPGGSTSGIDEDENIDLCVSGESRLEWHDRLLLHKPTQILQSQMIGPFEVAHTVTSFTVCNIYNHMDSL